MVATLVRLKLTLLRHSFSGDTGRVIALLAALFWGGGATLLAAVGLVAARGESIEAARPWVLSGLVGLTIGWIIMPLLFFGTDDTLDPRRFALLPLSARRLRPGLFAAGLLGIPGIGLIVIAAAQIVTWTRSPASTVVAVLSAPLALATCFLLSRVMTSAFSDALSSRRMRDLTAVVLGVCMLFIGVGNQLITRAAEQDSTRFEHTAQRVGDIASWTPIGWAWAAPVEVARGHLLAGLVMFALAAGLVALLWWAWGRLLAKALESTSAEQGGGEVSSHWIDRLTGTSPTGAVMGRCLRYWRRDPRYLTALASLFVAPVLLTFSMHASGNALYLGPVFIAVLSGQTLMSDLAYDNSAFWVHVVSPMSMRADRQGRAAALAVIVVPLMIVSALVLAAFTDEWDALPGCAALCVVGFASGMGVALYQGTKTPGKAPEPGGSAFGRGSGGGGFLVVLILLGCWLVTALCMAPVIVLVALGMAWVALPVAVVIAALVLTLGIRAGARQMERTLPELLAMVTT